MSLEYYKQHLKGLFACLYYCVDYSPQTDLSRLRSDIVWVKQQIKKLEREDGRRFAYNSACNPTKRRRET